MQSNILGGQPDLLAPHGVDGLLAASDSLFVVGDIVIPSFVSDSLDLIFTEEKSAVAFNTLAFSGPSVELRVYSMDNTFIGLIMTPANPTGTHFIGIWTPVGIGRINIFDPGGGLEGADNIQGWQLPPQLIWYDNQADFEAFVAGEGKLTKGIEDFEEAIMVPIGVEVFDDPLESGVSNSPNGSLFPDGMTGLPNLRVQSNKGGNNPMVEDPRGVNGLNARRFTSINGLTFTGVTANFNDDSLDLIFSNEKSAIGFSPIKMEGAFFALVEIRAYSTDNVFLGMTTSLATFNGFFFVGVSSSVPIGRINIFDTGGTREGADNIQAWSKLLWFDNQADFEIFNFGEGKVSKGTEDFEEAILNGFAFFDDPLEPAVPNGPFPDGLTGLTNLIVQSNVGGGNPIVPAPQGTDGLAAVSNGVFQAVSDVVFPLDTTNSLDLIFNDGKSGVGFNTLTFNFGDSVEVRVYSTANVLLGMMTTPADPTGADFIGVWSSDPIGRINIFTPIVGYGSADNIQAWEVGSVKFFPGDEIGFQIELCADAKNLKGTEDFPWLAPPVSDIVTSDPVDIFGSEGGWYTSGMLIDNLAFYANTGGADSTQLAPAGNMAIRLFTNGGFGAMAEADGLVANTPGHAFDIVSDNHSALGLTLVTFPSGMVTVTVYDQNNNLLGSMAVPASPNGEFLGIIVPKGFTIGRVNIFDPNDGAEGVYDVAAYFVNPCPWDLNFDGTVDPWDVILLIDDYGLCPGCICPADFNDDGVVDDLDLFILIDNWGDCGPECDNPGTCGNFSNCTADPDCVCYTLFDGGGLCAQAGFPLCADLELCPDGDCPPGQFCIVLSCCGDNVCIPEEAVCGP